MKYFYFFIIILTAAIPYALIGDSTAALIISLLAAVFLIFFSKESLRVDRKFFLLTVILYIAALSTSFMAPDVFDSVKGSFIYLSALMLYLLFSYIKDKNKGSYVLKTYEAYVFTMALLTVVSIFYEGAYLNRRIDATTGYANTFGLLLFAAIILNKLCFTKNIRNVVETILLTGIMFTSSRNTIFYLGIFVVIEIFKEYKSHKDFSLLLHLLSAIIVYGAVELWGLGALILIIIFVGTTYVWIKDFKNKTKNIIIIVMLILIVVGTFTAKTNLTQRIQNVSISNGSLMERFVYYEDAAKSIIKHPQGRGINSFEINEYRDESAFYDVKYIHNSVLQAAYDMGIAGLIIFLSWIVYGGYLIYKSSDKNKTNLLFLYVVIFLHSLLDFDFSFAVVLMLLVMLVAFEGRSDFSIKGNKHTKTFNILLIVFLSYMAFTTSLMGIGKLNSNQGNSKAAQNIYGFVEKISYKNIQVYQISSEDYNNNKDYKNCNNKLQEALDIYPGNVMVIGNMAFTYSKLNDANKAMEYFDKYLALEKYYYKMYEVYDNFLKENYKKTGEEVFNKKSKDIRLLYEENLKSLNTKAKYMKDQLNTIAW